MAQPFSYRYPLIDGQGNFGSIEDAEVVRGDALHRIEARRRSPSCCLPRSIRARSISRRTTTARSRSRRGCRRACRTCCSTARPASRSAWRRTFRRTTCAKSSPRAFTCSMIRPRASPSCASTCKGPDFPTAAEIITPKSELAGDVCDRPRLGALPRGSTRRRTATSSSPRCRTRCRRRRCCSRSTRSPRRRNCRCSRTTATNRTMKIRSASCCSRAPTASTSTR